MNIPMKTGKRTRSIKLSSFFLVAVSFHMPVAIVSSLLPVLLVSCLLYLLFGLLIDQYFLFLLQSWLTNNGLLRKKQMQNEGLRWGYGISPRIIEKISVFSWDKNNMEFPWGKNKQIVEFSFQGSFHFRRKNSEGL